MGLAGMLGTIHSLETSDPTVIDGYNVTLDDYPEPNLIGWFAFYGHEMEAV